MKTLIFDIELSKAVALVYPSHKPQYVAPENIIHDQFMPCAAWKWLDKKKIHLASVLDDKKRFKKDYRDHSTVIERLHAAVSEADILVGHNSDAFDIKHLNWFAKLQGLPPLAPTLTVDTLKESRKVFRAPSNKLDILAQKLVGNEKMRTSSGMHNRVALGCPKAIREMGKYNKQDIVIQEEVYLDIRPWMKRHPNQTIRNAITGDKITTCQSCNSPSLRRSKIRYLNSGRGRIQYQCNDCLTYTTGDLIK